MRRWIIFIIALLAFSVPGLAQEAETTWYLAADVDTPQLVFYTAEGETVSLATPFEERTITSLVLRVDEQTFLLQVEVEENTYQLTLASPTGLQPITDELNEGLRPLDYHYPYVVMAPLRQAQQNPLLLVNLEDHTARTLELPYDFGICCRFSQDGEVLRYVGVIRDEAAKTTERQIRELDLAAGTEQVLLTSGPQTTDDGLSYYSPNSDGTRWLERQNQREPRGMHYRIHNIDGTLELDESTTIEELLIYRFWGDTLLHWPARCEQDCLLEVQPPGDALPTTYPLDGLEDMPINIQPLALTDETLTLWTPDGLLLLRTDALAQIVGYLDFRTIFSSGPSSRGRFIALANSADDTQGYGLWDTQARRYVLNESLSGTIVTIRYTPQAIFIWEQGGRDRSQKMLVYDVATQRVKRFQAPTARGNFGELLSADLITYLQFGDDDLLAQGLYLYDIRLDRLTFVTPGRYRPLGGDTLDTIAQFAANQ